MSRAKLNSLILLLIVGALTLTLAMSVRDLVLSPGQPFSLRQPQPATLESAGRFSDGDFPRWILRGMLALVLILLPLYLFYSLFTPEGRRQLVICVVLMVVLFLLADYLRSQGGSTLQPAQPTMLPPRVDQLAESNPAPSFPMTPPPWLTLAVILAASILIVTSILAVIWLFQHRPITPVLPLEALAKEAQNALESLHTGGDLTMTIIRCYQEMSRVVEEEKGITRETAMTPREFEDRLVSRGLPQGSIRTLTRLFERVRYGSIPAGAQEENLAFSCLTEIANACIGVGNEYEGR